ncbi:hypothetical protein Tco_1382424, partial [Tanacetum coccineum]
QVDYRKKMDDPNITIEEYIRLEEEKAQRHGRTLNWQTTTFGKVKNYEDEDDCFIDFETKFPTIVFDNTALPSDPTSKSDYLTEPILNLKHIDEFNLNDETSLSEYDKENVLRFNDLFNIIRPDDLKSEKDNDDNDIDIIQYSEGNETTPRENLRAEARDDMEQRDNRMSDTEMGLDVADTLCFQLRGIRRRMKWRQFILALGLHTEQEMAETGFEAYWDGNFLGLAPSYVLIRDHVRRLCHRMIAYSISGKGQAPEKVTGVDLFYLHSMDRGTTNVPHLLAQYLFRHAEGRKSRAKLSGGHFIGGLAMHFGLVSDKGLRGLQVVTRELPLIDLHELGRLNIYSRFGDTWAWVAQGPERQQGVAAGAHKADEAGLAAEEGAQTISQRIERIEEEVHDLRRDVVGLRGFVESFTTEQSRVSTWLISCMTQLMDVIGHTYQAFDSTLVGSLRMPYQRRVRPRTGEANTSAAPHTDAQPDP